MKAKNLVIVKLPNGCARCTSHDINRSKYPRIVRNGKERSIVRYLWEQIYGGIPKGSVIRHKCDNPNCVNIDHIEIGTTADNNRDRMIRGRGVHGSETNTSKLTAEQALSIRKNKDRLTQRELGMFFGVSHTAIRYIQQGRNWKYL